MKNNSKEGTILDESNNIICHKKYYEKHQKKKKYYNIIILMILLLIMNLIVIIKIFTQLKGLNSIYYRNITNKSNNKEQMVLVDLYDSPLETFDSKILANIQTQLLGYIELTINEQRFFNGLLRKIKPKKIVEIGVSSGGSSSLILNAIKDIEGAKLYSIEKLKEAYKFKDKEAGFIVKEKFPYLMNKWNLYTGGITSEFIEKIGGEIDLVFIDTAHYTPGEMLDWLQVLPFLKEEAIVVFHDTFLMYYKSITKKKRNFSNNLLFTYIRGELHYNFAKLWKFHIFS